MLPRLLTLLLALIALVTVSCSSEAVDRCPQPLADPGEYERFNTYDGAQQKYWVVVPDSSAGAGPAPLYLVLAFDKGDPDSMLGLWRSYIAEDTEAIHVVAGTASEIEGRPGTLVALIDQVAAEFCVDERRIHALGASSSAPISARLACQASDRIASFFSGIGPTSPTDCVPTRPVPMLSITGDPERDTEVLPGVEKWAELNGCQSDPVVEELGQSVRRVVYRGCAADVLLYDVVGMGHAMPMHDCSGLMGCRECEELDYVEEFERFFADHPLP